MPESRWTYSQSDPWVFYWLISRGQMTSHAPCWISANWNIRLGLRWSGLRGKILVPKLWRYQTDSVDVDRAHCEAWEGWSRISILGSILFAACRTSSVPQMVNPGALLIMLCTKNIHEKRFIFEGIRVTMKKLSGKAEWYQNRTVGSTSRNLEVYIFRHTRKGGRYPEGLLFSWHSSTWRYFRRDGRKLAALSHEPFGFDLLEQCRRSKLHMVAL